MSMFNIVFSLNVAHFEVFIGIEPDLWYEILYLIFVILIALIILKAFLHYSVWFYT